MSGGNQGAPVEAIALYMERHSGAVLYRWRCGGCGWRVSHPSAAVSERRAMVHRARCQPVSTR